LDLDDRFKKFPVTDFWRHMFSFTYFENSLAFYNNTRCS
jgi:hypothetical protein